MPQSIVDKIVLQTDNGYEMLNTTTAWGYKFLSHVLDTIGHPMIVYLFWRIHKSHQGTLKDLLSWPVLILAWHMSRFWSIVHSYHNKGTFDFWYFGHDVYVLNDSSVYLTAYVAEGLCFGGAVIWKLLFEGRKVPLSEDPALISDLIASQNENKADDKKPILIHSESADSASSMTSLVS